jgi:hypothetical protein
MKVGRASGTRIDILGPHGVGKTTLARALTHPGGFSPTLWLGQEDARVKIATKLAWSAGKFAHRTRAPLFKLPRIGGAIADRYLRLPTELALEERRSDWRNFIGACFRSIAPLSGIDSVAALLRCRRVVDRLGEIALIEKYGCRQPVLMDESLTQFVSVLYFDARQQKDVTDALQSFPLPAAVLYVSGVEQEIVRRLAQREDATHAAVENARRNEEELAAATRRSLDRCEALVPTLESRGVPILTLNGFALLEVQVKAANEFLRKIFTSSG